MTHYKSNNVKYINGLTFKSSLLFSTQQTQPSIVFKCSLWREHILLVSTIILYYNIVEL